jgi:eukaryotic-like serine/threonine-protein kinase
MNGVDGTILPAHPDGAGGCFIQGALHRRVKVPQGQREVRVTVAKLPELWRARGQVLVDECHAHFSRRCIDRNAYVVHGVNSTIRGVAGSGPPGGSAPRLIANRYREIGPLGERGVCGQTLRCYDITEECEVAVKVIETHGGAVGPWDEARYLRRLGDPHILPIRNALEDLGQPILVTEIAEGGTVGDRLVLADGLLPLTAIDWVRHACLGTARAHHDGLIHNDIKPGNLFLTATDRCMVGDFGFATLIDPAVGKARMLGATPTTGAPEAITGALTGQPAATPASDVYSLGATLYWLLSGAPPVPRTLSHEYARNFVLAGNIPPLKTVAPHVGDYLCRVVAKTLSPDPGDRHQTVIDLHAELTSVRAVEATGRQWRIIATDAGHEKCWECLPLGNRKALRVCLVPGGRSNYEIEVVYSSSRRRFKPPEATTSAGRASNLRKMFKPL